MTTFQRRAAIAAMLCVIVLAPTTKAQAPNQGGDKKGAAKVDQGAMGGG